MKILLITPTDINQGYGGSIRTTCLREALMDVGEVHTVVFRYGPVEHWDDEWQDGFIRTTTHTRGGWSREGRRQRAKLRSRISGLIAQYGYDIIVVRFLSTAFVVPRFEWSRIVADADDAIKIAHKNTTLLTRIILPIRNRMTTRIADRLRHVWFVNPHDARHLPTCRKSLLRNVIPFPDPNRPRVSVIPYRILMVGLMTYLPNLHGARWFAEKVLPALTQRFPDVELHVIGKYPQDFKEAFKDTKVVVRGFIENLAPEYDQAALVIAPIFSGAGTQIKVIDALAHQRPLITSPLAYSGFTDDLRAPDYLLTATSPSEWIKRCSQVLMHPEEAEVMASRGLVAVAPYGPANMAATVKETLTSSHMIPGTR